MVFCLSIFIMIPSSAAEPDSSLSGIRAWKEAGTDRTVRGRIDGKKDDGSEIRIVLENHKAIWIPMEKLSAEDRKLAAGWEKLNVRLDARTIAMGSNRSKWSATWVATDRDAAAILSASKSQELQGRSLGITLDNRGTAQNLIVDVFWFGFPLNDKSKRVVCSRATKVLRAPSEDRYTISCALGYRYVEESLTLVAADFRRNVAVGLFAKSWAGHSYAGWAVRVSKTSGEIIAETASQPALLGRLKDVPSPSIKPKKPGGQR